MVRVKICCMASTNEVARAAAAGASAVGFVSEMPSGPGVVDDARIRVMAAATPPGVSRFLLTSRVDGEGIRTHAVETGVEVVQICDHVDRSVWEEIGKNPTIRIVQVVHVCGPAAVDFALAAAPHVHALLLDSGQPGAEFQELGGTGRTHDWEISARIVRESTLPVWLAGGLNAENVGKAIAMVKPFGVDLCTGVRSSGALDQRKLNAFMDAVRCANGRTA